jgi:anthranilate synthase component 2
MKTRLRALMIDNFDSFTYNLVDEFAKRGCEVMTYRNTLSLDSLGKILNEGPVDLIILSPGPGNPAQAGICIPLIREYCGRVAIFGVCLGLQAMVEALGGRVGGASRIVHGKTSAIRHDGRTIFRGLGNPLPVARYHSLCALTVPQELEVSAETEDGTVMAVRHCDAGVFLEGVQFHPESVMTTQGGIMIENVIEMVGRRVGL